jgi:biopolymer transport protein ExbB
MNLINRLPALLVAALVAWAPAAAMFVAPLEARAQAPAQPSVGSPTAEPAAPADAAKAPAATPAPPPGAGEPAKEVIENPYGLEALWKQGDFVSKGTLIILVIMSMGSWYIMFVKVYEQMKLFRQARDV